MSSPRLLAAAGAAASAGVVVGATRAGWTGVNPPAGPLGLWRPAATGRGWFAVLAAVSVCALAVVFLRLYRQAAAGGIGTGGVARVALAWCVPVLPAPPLLSLDAYSYAAQGWLLLSRLDPYTVGPERLGAGPILDAVSPVWRATPAPYGPLALAGLRQIAALGEGNLTATVYLLRLIAVLAVVGSAVLAVRLADPPRKVVTLVLVAANPLVVLHLVGGVHLDALLAGLAVLAVLATHRRWWALAAITAATAFAIKLPGLVLVAYVLVSRARTDGPISRGTLGTAAITAATAAGCATLVPNGWGWIGALQVPGRIRHPYDPATALGWLLHQVTWVTFAEAVSVARVLAAIVGAVVIAVLVWRAAGAAVGCRTAAALIGGALVVVALAAPTLHAWYAVWGLALVAAGAAARTRWWMAGLSVALCFTALPDPRPNHPLGVALRLVLLVACFLPLMPASRLPVQGRAT